MYLDLFNYTDFISFTLTNYGAISLAPQLQHAVGGSNKAHSVTLQDAHL
jgi:hypothetical protein